MSPVDQDYDDQQIQLEQQMAELGAERARQQIQRSEGRMSTSRVGAIATSSLTKGTLDALTAWHKEATGPRSGRMAGRRFQALPLIAELPLSVWALLAAKTTFDNPKGDQPFNTVAIRIGKRADREILFRRIQKQAPRLFKYLREKSTSEDFAWDMARRMLKNVKLGESRVFTTRQRLIVGALLLELLLESTDIFEVVKRNPPRAKKFIVLTEKGAEWLAKSEEALELRTPYFLPMLATPGDYSNFTDGGYRTNLVVRRPVVKDWRTAQLRRFDPAQCRPVLTAINTLQRTGWSVNDDVLEVARHFWENDQPAGGMPSISDVPVPPKPDYGEEDSPEREVYLQWRRRRGQLGELNCATRSLRVNVAKTLHLATEYSGRQFFYPYHMDFRGRAYPLPSFLQPQGSDMGRALLQFHEGKAILGHGSGDQTFLYLVNGANLLGVKGSLTDRAVAMMNLESQHREISQDPIATRELWESADSPWQYLAWAIDRAAMLEDKNHQSHIPVQMDGSNNGLQLYSLLMGDPEGAAATNCRAASNSHEPRDLYQDVAEAVTNELTHLAVTDPQSPKAWMARRIMAFLDGEGMPRKAMKRLVMTIPYGCTRFRALDYMRDWYHDVCDARGLRLNARRLPLDDYDIDASRPSEWRHLELIRDLAWEAVHRIVGRPLECMDWIRECVAAVGAGGKLVEWTSPLGLPVVSPYRRRNSRVIRTSIGQRTRVSRYATDTTKINVAKQVRSSPPNFIHSLDAALMMATVNGCAQQGIGSFMMVHDSFATHAADAPAMRRVLRQKAVSIFEQNQLQIFHDQLAKQAGKGTLLPDVPERGRLDIHELLEAAYFFA